MSPPNDNVLLVPDRNALCANISETLLAAEIREQGEKEKEHDGCSRN
jgi:hypothetical protein